VSAATGAPLPPLGRMLLRQTWSELLIRWRIPAFSVTSLALPILFFTFFGLPFARLTSPDGVSLGAFMLASFGAYGVGSVMVYGFGIGVANERAQRTDLLVRATPLPPAIYLLAKVLVALLFALVSVLALIGYGMVVGGIRQPAAVWGAMVLRLLAGSLPFIALGFWIGYASGPHAAPAVANFVYLPLAFASGFFLPIHQLPGFVQQIAPYLPTYHLAQLAWSAVGARSGSVAMSLAWLLGYTVLFLALAVRAYTRDQRRKFA
jgi:ABC-2 type transport system permease protein